MTPETDVYQTTQSHAFAAATVVDAQPLEEDVRPDALFQEINERRARIENAELLRHLRGL